MSGSEMEGSDGVVANTRCSPKRIAEVVKTFCSLKRRLVSEIGFKGMLKVPEISNLDKKFTISLLEKIDIKRRAFKLSHDTFIGISAEDVHRYLDIPNGPNQLYGLDDRSASEKMDFIRFGIGSSSYDIDEKNSLRAAEEIVTAHYPNGMSDLQAEQFKISFVCFCMGNFLMAKYSSNHGIKDYWGSLMETTEISSYNFCQAVVDEIIEAARHVQKELKADRQIKNVSGCHLYLQAKFLDSVHLGQLNICHIPLPRIQAFNSVVIQQMKTALRQNSVDGGSKEIQSDAQKVNEIRFTIRELPWLKKGFEAPTDVCPYVNSVKKPPSTEYLCAYAAKNFDKRLNEKQIGALRLHNARIKLFINNFKKKTLADMDVSAYGKESCKFIFGSNVDRLMEDALSQVLVLSKSLHEHQVIQNTSNPTACVNLDDQQTIVPYETSIECAPRKRPKRRNFEKNIANITGKNLFYDLTETDGHATGTYETPIKIEAAENNFMDLTMCDGSSLAGKRPTHSDSEGFVTPKNKISNASMIQDIPDYTSISAAQLVFPKMICNESSSTNKYRTPQTSLRLSAQPIGTMVPYTADEPFDDIMEDAVSLDLNQLPPHEDIIITPMKKHLCIKGSMAKNPWFFGVARRSVKGESSDQFFDWLAQTKSSTLDSAWIKHSYPKKIKIYGNDFKSVYTRGFNFTPDLLDLAVRRFGDIDLDMYGDGAKLRWMHPFESDYARRVLNGEEYLNSHSVRGQLTGRAEEYDISNCRMVSVPHLDELTWTVYIWDMKERLVHVLDPTFQADKACELNDFHAPIVKKLQGGLEKSFGTAFDDWQVDWANWKKNYVHPFLPGKKSNESGMLTLLAMRYFNGTRFELQQTEVALKNFGKQLLYDVLSIEGNTGLLPDVFFQ